MPLREPRRFKTKGFAISFGDIMLPLVAVVAIGLVWGGAKLFFSPAQQPPVHTALPVIPEAPRVQRQQEGRIAQAREKNSGAEPSGEPSSRQPLSAEPSSANTTPKPPSAPKPNFNEEPRPAAKLDVLAVPYDGETTSGPVARTKEIVVSRTPSAVPPQPALGASSPQTQRAARPPAGNPGEKRPSTQSAGQGSASKPASSISATSTPAPSTSTPSTPAKPEPKWLVQAGAFSTQAAAQAFAEQITKAGYTPTLVISGNPLHRVLVQAGNSRDEAMKLAARMSQSGFQGAFIIPPRP